MVYFVRFWERFESITGDAKVEALILSLVSAFSPDRTCQAIEKSLTCFKSDNVDAFTDEN